MSSIPVVRLPEPITSALRWVPSEFSTASVVKRELKSRLVRPFVTQDYESITVTDREWDTLVILDACRYDVFEANNPFPVAAERVNSSASHTFEFLHENFAGSYPDLVYVSATPQLAEFDGSFAHVEHVWRDGWDDEHGTVRPETMTDRALSVAEAYPEKRLVVHYMQPHYPFIGSKSDALQSQGSYMNNLRDRTYPSVWERLDAGDADEQLVREAYEENLQLALPAVERLVGALSGKTVITSDHGNLFGKRVSPLPIRLYGHPPEIPDEELTAVPWVELPFDERRRVQDAETRSSTTDDGDVEERLESLGYV